LLLNNALYAVGTVVPSLVLALAFALALNGAGRVRARHHRADRVERVVEERALEGRVGEEGGEVVQAHEAAVTRRGTRFVGLDNFAALFADPTFQRALLNNALYAVTAWVASHKTSTTGQ
jgi:ABC-type sugar transport system permease subunit